MAKRKRRSDKSGRAKLCSPGRPDAARREGLAAFWAAIATGASSEAAASAAGVSPAVGARWFRRAGGMAPTHLAVSAPPLTGRYLSFAEREEIALGRAVGRGVRDIARRLGRAPSTISREIRRNAATRSGGLEYRASAAQWHADRSARRPKSARLAMNAAPRADNRSGRTGEPARRCPRRAGPRRRAPAGPSAGWSGAGPTCGRRGAPKRQGSAAPGRCIADDAKGSRAPPARA